MLRDRKVSLFWKMVNVLIIIIIIVVFITVQKNDEEQNTNSYSTISEALHAGVDETMKIHHISNVDDELYEPVFEYKDQENYYFLNKLILKGTDDLAYSENLYVIKVMPKGRRYLSEQVSALVSIKQVNEKGEAFYPTWTIPIKGQLAFIVGMVENPEQEIYAGIDQVKVHKDGIYVYVFKEKGDSPEISFE